MGKERDDETGLYYYGARYYASWLCRFVSVDPLKDNYPQLASYQYAGNDPVGDIDINGLQGTKTENRKPKTLENAKAGDIVLLPNGSTALMMEEVVVSSNNTLPSPQKLDFEGTSKYDPEGELVKTGAIKATEESGKIAGAGAENIEGSRVEQGYATSQKGKTSKFPTEQRQVKFYRPDGTEELQVVTQAKNSGNFDPGDSNKGIKRTGSTKFTKGLKGFAELTGLAGDFIDLGSALKGFAEGDIDAVLDNAPGLGPVFAGINAQSDEVMRDFLFRKFNSLLFTGSTKELADFLKGNKNIGLEVIYLTNAQINAIQNGERLEKFEIDAFYPENGKIPAIVNSKSYEIKIHATIHN